MEDLESNIENAEEWLKNLGSNLEIAPQVSRLVENAKAYKQILDSAPASASVIVGKIYPQFTQGIADVSINLTPLPPNTHFDIDRSLALDASGATGSYSELITFEKEDDPEVHKWQAQSTLVFRELQDKQNRTRYIESTIRPIDQFLADDFNVMNDLYENYKNEYLDHSGFGIKIRNIHEHFYGIIKKPADLIYYGKVRPKKKIAWTKLSSSVCLGGENSCYYKEMLNLQHAWLNLHKALSIITKDYKPKKKLGPIEYYTRLINLMYSILLLIDLGKL